MTNGSTYSEELDMDSAWYLIDLRGGAGGTQNSAIGGTGGYIVALHKLNGNNIYELCNYAGGSGDYTGKGGDAVALVENGNIILGAGGGGGAAYHSTKNSTMRGHGGNVPGGNGANGTNNPNFLLRVGVGSPYLSSGGGSAKDSSGENGICPIEGKNPATGGYSNYAAGPVGGGAGSNYIDSLIETYGQPNGNTETVSSAKVIKLDSGYLPTVIGTGVSGNTSNGYTVKKDSTYTIKLQTNGGDIVQANIDLKSGDTIQVIRSNGDVGKSWLCYLNGTIMLAEAGGTQGSLSATQPTLTEIYGPDTVATSYVNTAYMTGVKYNNTTPDNSMLYSIIAKEPTVEDTYDYQRRQAIAQENMAMSLATMSGNITIPTVTVVAGQSFSVCVGSYDDMITGSSDGITVTNSVQGDGLIVLSGKIDSPGIYNVTINGKKFGITAINEPNSGNVTAILR